MPRFRTTSFSSSSLPAINCLTQPSLSITQRWLFIRMYELGLFRPIYSVRLLHSSSYFYAQIFPVLRGSRPYKRLRPAPGIVYHANSIELATEWLFAGLRCAQVCKSFELQNVALSKHFLTQLKEAAPIFNVSGKLGPCCAAIRVLPRSE